MARRRRRIARCIKILHGSLASPQVAKSLAHNAVTRHRTVPPPQADRLCTNSKLDWIFGGASILMVATGDGQQEAMEVGDDGYALVRISQPETMHNQPVNRRTLAR